MTTRYHPLSIMFTAAFALAAAAVPAKDRAELEVKGLRIGMTRAEFTAQFPAAACHSAELCQVSTTIADTAATFNVSFHDGVVDQAYVGKFAAARRDRGRRCVSTEVRRAGFIAGADIEKRLRRNVFLQCIHVEFCERRADRGEVPR